MSVAQQLVHPFPVPLQARPEGAQRLASVSVLRAPSEPALAPPVRLTRRGVVVLTVAVALLGVGLVWLGRLSAPQPASGAPAPRTVTVQPGDTLWAIAARVAPQQDPRAEVAALQARNHLSGVGLAPGQVLRVR
jgi:Tfp pilus assembly protein FimV